MKRLKFLLGTLYKKFVADPKFSKFSQEQNFTFILGEWVVATFHNFEYGAEKKLVDRFCKESIELVEKWSDKCFNDVNVCACDPPCCEPSEINVWLSLWSVKIAICIHQHKNRKNYDNVLNGELFWKCENYEVLWKVFEKAMGMRCHWVDDRKEYVKI